MHTSYKSTRLYYQLLLNLLMPCDQTGGWVSSWCYAAVLKLDADLCWWKNNLLCFSLSWSQQISQAECASKYTSPVYFVLCAIILFICLYVAQEVEVCYSTLVNMSDLKNYLKRCFLSQTLFRNYLCSFLIVGPVFFLFYLLDSECNSNETETSTTTTTVTTGPRQICNFSIGADTSENGSITGLIPGTIYQIFFNCLNCCKEVTTSKSVCFVELLIF